MLLWTILSTASAFVTRQPSVSLAVSKGFDDDIPLPDHGLYEIQEEAVTRRGQLEATIMTAGSPLQANKPKGTGTGGGFATSGSRPKGSLTAQGKEHAKVLRREGVVRIDNVLQEGTATALREFVYQLRDQALSDVESGKVKHHERFADVLLRKNRVDLTMPWGEDIVKEGLYDALVQSSVGATLGSLLGKTAPMYEFSCLISDPGSDRQVVHPDTPCASENEEPVLYTCFIALQDITLDMGPTVWLPKTHTAEMHTAFFDENINEATQESPKDTLLRQSPSVLGTLSKGSCAIFDSRCLHCGTANQSSQSRSLFYFSFKNPKVGYPGNPASIRPENVGKFTLESLTKELELYRKTQKVI